MNINVSNCQFCSHWISAKAPIFFHRTQIRLLNSEVLHSSYCFCLTNSAEFLETGTAFKALTQTSIKAPVSLTSRGKMHLYKGLRFSAGLTQDLQLSYELLNNVKWLSCFKKLLFLISHAPGLWQMQGVWGKHLLHPICHVLPTCAGLDPSSERVVPFRCSNLTAGRLTMLFSLSKACPPAFPGSFMCSSCLAARKYRAASDVWFGTSKIWASLLLLAARASPYLRPGGTAYRSHRDQCHCHSMGHLLADAA